MSSYTNTDTNTAESEWKYSESEIAHEFLFFNVLKDGRVHVLPPPSLDENVLPSFGSTVGVSIKDVEITPDVSARILLPSSTTAQKLPVVFYIHGGGFCMRSAFSENYTRFCSNIATEANAIVVSVEYGLFPARPIPACYDDSWAALQWLASHGNGSGPEPWINDHADLHRIFVGGDSAGGNISHTLLAKVGSMGLPGEANIEGMILVHPYFGEDDKMWMYMCPTNEGPTDPRMKPAVEDLARIGCDRVLVFLGEIDGLYGVGKMYTDELIKSGWKGTVEIVVNKEKDHCFHLPDYTDLEAVAIRRLIASFINNQG
ncbi:probable carboxylesterase 1 [Spinacia oleracea]|uniref:Probable carboxylesterase 1 n=1 Tax=Spinacia oleracea TaxID=3562 RepID=A0ABM3REZ9_SPIOL|nr:probable carboxylesterase 1 [Spinacia oleracea]XP_056694196.1 probable carboxylesterase 1 [Spinacia oleracea]